MIAFPLSREIAWEYQQLLTAIALMMYPVSACSKPNSRSAPDDTMEAAQGTPAPGTHRGPGPGVNGTGTHGHCRG